MRDHYAERGRERAGAPARGIAVLLAVTFLAFVNYAALLPVVPMWASHGGAASAAVGVTTGGMMAATVVTQIAMPWLLGMFRLRSMMVIGAILLGGPTPMYLLSVDFTAIMVITVLRGIGFAFVVTAGATLVADLAGDGRLSFAASLYGVAAALPNLAALAGGVWVADAWGYDLVFWTSGAACLGAAVLSSALPAQSRGRFRLGPGTSARLIAPPIVQFALTAAAFGAVATFLPLARPDAATSSLALLVASAALIVGRLTAGAIGDEYGSGRVLVASGWMCALGLGTMALSVHGSAVVLIVGAALLGAGFGASQNDSFVVTITRMGRGNSGTASAIWNIAYDGGLGAGAVVVGGVIGQLGYSIGFFVMAGAVAVVAILLRSNQAMMRSGRAA